MRKILLISALMATLMCSVEASADNREQTRERNRRALAERFTADKLQNMLFSISVDPH